MSSFTTSTNLLFGLPLPPAWQFQYSLLIRGTCTVTSLTSSGKLFITWQNDIHCKVKREAHAKAKASVQTQVRILKNQWWTKALELQQLADSGDTRGFFDATRAVYGPSSRCLTPFRSKDGLFLLKNNEAIKNRWKEHYMDLLNRDTTPAMEQLP